MPYQLHCFDCGSWETVESLKEALAIEASHKKNQPPITKEGRTWNHRVSVYRGVGPEEKSLGGKILRRYPLQGGMYCQLCNQVATWILDQGWRTGIALNYLCDHHSDSETQGHLRTFIFDGVPTDLETEAKTLTAAGIWTPDELYDSSSEALCNHEINEHYRRLPDTFVVGCNTCQWKRVTETEARAALLRDQHERRLFLRGEKHFARIYRGDVPVTFSGEKDRRTLIPIDQWEHCRKCGEEQRAAWYVEPQGVSPEALVGGSFLCEYHSGRKGVRLKEKYKDADGCGFWLVCFILMTFLIAVSIATV